MEKVQEKVVGQIQAGTLRKVMRSGQETRHWREGASNYSLNGPGLRRDNRTATLRN